MAQRRNTGASKAENVTAAAKGIEITAKKQLGKINAERLAEEEALQTECQSVKKELELVKAEDPNSESWANQALGVADHMKSIIRKQSELRHQLLLKIDELAKDLEIRSRPIKKELPTILDFSEEDRVHLNLLMDKAMHEVTNKRAEIAEDEIRLQNQMSVLINNTPDPAAPKDVVSKLQTAFDTITLANDPEMVRKDLLANMSGCQKKESPSKTKKTDDKGPARQKKV